MLASSNRKNRRGIGLCGLATAIAVSGCLGAGDVAQDGEPATGEAVSALITNPTIGGPAGALGTTYCSNLLNPKGYCFNFMNAPLTTAAQVLPYLNNAAANWGCTFNPSANAVLSAGGNSWYKWYGSAANPSQGCGVVWWNYAKQAAYFQSNNNTTNATTSSQLFTKFCSAGVGCSESGKLGLPISNPIPYGWTSTTYQLFTKGVITYNATYGAHFLGGPNAEDQALVGAFNGAFGVTPIAAGSPAVYPLEMDPGCTSVIGTSCNALAKTGVYSKWRDSYWNLDSWVVARTGWTNAFDLPGPIATQWVTQAGANAAYPWTSALGFPLSRLSPTTSSTSLQQFEGGTIGWSPSACVAGNPYVATSFLLGAPPSTSRAPVANMICNGGAPTVCNPGQQSSFTATGIASGTGKVTWGCKDAGVGVPGSFDQLAFEGTNTSDGTYDVKVLQEPFLSSWLKGAANCVNSSTCTVQRAISSEFLGRPTSDAVDIYTGQPAPAATVPAANHGRVQRFEGGNLYKTPNGSVFSVEGPILTAYLAAGGPAVLGYPTGDAPNPTVATAKSQSFEFGSIDWNGITPPLTWYTPSPPRWLFANNINDPACTRETPTCSTSVKLWWSNPDPTQPFSLERSVAGGAWTKLNPGAPWPAGSQQRDWIDTSATPWTKSCYRVSMNSLPPAYSGTACVQVRDGRNIQISRAQIRITTDAASGSGTNGRVWVNLGDKVTTWLDSNVDDFTPSSARTYDLNTSNELNNFLPPPQSVHMMVKDIRDLSDIGSLTIGVDNDDLCISSIALDVNVQTTTAIGGENTTQPGATVFRKTFSPAKCVNDKLYDISEGQFAHVIRIEAWELSTGGAGGSWATYSGLGTPATPFTNLNNSGFASAIMGKMGDRLKHVVNKVAHFQDNGAFVTSVIKADATHPWRVKVRANIHVNARVPYDIPGFDTVSFNGWVDFYVYVKEVGCASGPHGTDIFTEYADAGTDTFGTEGAFKSQMRVILNTNVPAAEPFPIATPTGIDASGGIGFGGSYWSCADQGL